MTVKKIAIGCDHAGFPYKDAIIKALKKEKIEVIDFGTNLPNSVDYPDFAHPTANAVENKTVDFGILLCGSGNGVAITANKHQRIRCALCWKTEIATLARQHNDANIIAVPVRFVGKRLAINMIKSFINSEFEGGRHQNRVDKIACA